MDWRLKELLERYGELMTGKQVDETTKRSRSWRLRDNQLTQ
jgi:predicted DNA-binding protein YlxM (UPF0122 family)